MIPKKAAGAGREQPLDDPKFLRACFYKLHLEQTEFPIKVEGTSTLPYTAQVEDLDGEKRQMLLKLQRPLPPELLVQAVFRMVFNLDEQRYEALVHYLGREAYLRYRFTLPEQLVLSDRRREKRYAFRPRENAYVTAHDGGIPGIVASGPLSSLSMGGLSLRVDRIIQLEGKVRMPVTSGALERGKLFVKIRIQDLPKHPVLELRGQVAHLSERGSEVHLGFQFVDLGAADRAALEAVLAIREKSSRGGPSGPAGAVSRPAPAARRAAARGEDEEPAAEGAHEAPHAAAMAPSSADTMPPFLLLRRRAAQGVLVMTPSPQRDQVQTVLARHGYRRLRTADSLEEAQELMQGTLAPGAPGEALLVVHVPSLEMPDESLLDRLHDLERLGEWPTVILHEAPDPDTLRWAVETQSTVLSPFVADEIRWIKAVHGVFDRFQKPA